MSGIITRGMAKGSGSAAKARIVRNGATLA
jgi:hypothetical protein